MGGNDSIDHSSISLEVNEFATWNADDSEDECDCPGPPPEFYLPPPPWPHCVSDFRCIDNGISEMDICKTFSVISDEYGESLTLTPLSVIPIVAVVVFLFIGIILVIVRRNKVGLQQMHSRQSSISYCESAIASSIIYEDMTDIHLREVTSLESPCQLRSSEMIRVGSCTSQKTLSPVLTCSSLSVSKSHRSKDLFSPVYEELANVHEEKRRKGGEGMLGDFNSGDECEEDEVSLEGRIENYPNLVEKSRSTLLLGTDVAQFLRNFPVSDDKSRFLGNRERDLNSVSCRKRGGRIFQGVDLYGSNTEKRLRRSDKKRERKNRVYSDSNSCCSRTDDGIFLKKLFQCYPNAPETGSACSIRPSLNTKCDRHFLFNGRHNHYSREIIFTTLKRDKGLGQDSYL